MTTKGNGTCRLTHLNEHRHVVTRCVLIGAMLITTFQFMFMITPVGASSWSTFSSGYCGPPTATGTTQVNWSGYSAGTWTDATNWLYWWDGASWSLRRKTFQSGGGTNGTTQAYSTYGSAAGLWASNGTIHASFTGGVQQDSYAPNFSC
ncbi:MAG: hypothetical protein H0X37_07300 [Herpetosiphonaceae bacterium]|nr:hypothetical protein [Herpetosiphonaceae bacterium]